MIVRGRVEHTRTEPPFRRTVKDTLARAHTLSQRPRGLPLCQVISRSVPCACFQQWRRRHRKRRPRASLIRPLSCPSRSPRGRWPWSRWRRARMRRWRRRAVPPRRLLAEGGGTPSDPGLQVGARTGGTRVDCVDRTQVDCVDHGGRVKKEVKERSCCMFRRRTRRAKARARRREHLRPPESEVDRDSELRGTPQVNSSFRRVHWACPRDMEHGRELREGRQALEPGSTFPRRRTPTIGRCGTCRSKGVRLPLPVPQQGR